MLMRLFLLMLMALALIAPIYAHVPAGHSLKVSAQVEDYSVRIIVFPAKPEVNKSSEIIVGIINSKTNAPFNGYVRINGVPATQFSQGFYEVKYVFREVGDTNILFEFTGQKELETVLTAEVVGGSGPSKLFLGGVFTMLSMVFIIVGYLRYHKK
jgi:hypothetical protein